MVVTEYHWPPAVVEGLFFDNEDYNGLFFWSDFIEEQAKKMKK